MYYVLGDGGAKFGPADVPTLKQWAAEGRLTQTTMLEDDVTGQVMPATDIPELFATAAPADPGMPSTSASSPYTVPGPATTGAEASSPYGAPVHNPGPSQYQNPHNPYPRMDSVASPEANTYATWTWILGAVGFCCCCCLSIASIFTAVKARQLGHPKGDILLFYAIGMTVGGVVLSMIVNAATGGYASMMNR